MGTRLSTPEGEFIIVYQIDGFYRVLRVKDWILSLETHKTATGCINQLQETYGAENVKVIEFVLKESGSVDV